MVRANRGAPIFSWVAVLLGAALSVPILSGNELPRYAVTAQACKSVLSYRNHSAVKPARHNGIMPGHGRKILIWPNEESAANSDPWLSEYHEDIRQMRPKVLALNFVNARTMEDMLGQLAQMTEVIAEASRYHGYSDRRAKRFLEYEIAYPVDLRDEEPPPDWPYNNSTLYPREEPREGAWGFDYEQLFTEEFAQLYGIEDPDGPGQYLDLCELTTRGLVHEVWIYGDGDLPYEVNAAEILELKPYYDEDRVRLDLPMNRCAGNGCFDAEDYIPESCTSTVRIAWFNHNRGPGCFLESLSHGFETIGANQTALLPTLSRDFIRFANFRLYERFDVPWDSWYSCPYGVLCLDYPTMTSVEYEINGVTGFIDPYDAVCGNVHFPPNARLHYDQTSPYTVMTTCEGFGLGGGPGGGDVAEPFSVQAFEPYLELAPDCMGAFLVYWRQNFPGLDNCAVDDEGGAILNWWPYIFY